MKLKTFFEKFDLFADAPHAVAKMRELVLELAVQGRLIATTDRDDWVAMRLGDIVAERLSSVNPADTPNQLFELWSVPSYASGRPEIVTGGKIGSTKRELPDHSILLGKINPHLNRVWKVSRKTKHTLIASPEWITITPGDSWDPDYLSRLLTSPSFNRELCSTAQGMGSLTRASTKKMAELEIRRPPLAEQKRIVAKVDELMALCDRLEAQQQERETRHAALARASLARFAEAPTPANLHFIFHKSYDIPPADLRKSLLTLAVQGKLVPQDPNDEAAEAVLNRVANERGNNIEQSSDDARGTWGPITESEEPFHLPSSWRRVRLGDIAGIKHGFAFSSDLFTSEPTPFVLTTPGNFHETGGFRDRGPKTKYYDGPVPAGFILKAGDLIIPMTEQAAGLLGSPAFIPDDGKTYIHNQRLGKLTFYSESIAPEFVFWFFNCEYFRDALARTCTGMKVRHTSPKKILTVPFPLCSLAEQRRIVAKVEQLMALVDALETQLAASRATAANVLSALVAELTAQA